MPQDDKQTVAPPPQPMASSSSRVVDQLAKSWCNYLSKLTHPDQEVAVQELARTILQSSDPEQYLRCVVVHAIRTTESPQKLAPIHIGVRTPAALFPAKDHPEDQ